MSALLTKVEGPYEVHDFTVADGASISGGTLCKLSGARVASAAVLSGEEFAGVTATDKLASNGKTELGLNTTGIFLMTADAAIHTGQILVMSGANMVRPAVAAELLTGAVVGKAYQDIAKGSTGEVRLTSI